MMMGHHGLRMLLRLAEESLEENRRRRGEGLPPRSEGEGLREEVRRLYARGELDRETFLELRRLAERGQLTRTDLEEARLQAREILAMESPEAREASAALAELRRQERALERAKTDSEATAGRIEAQLADLKARAGQDEEEARRVVLDDEARARSLLEHRESILEEEERLRLSVQALRQDIRRMDDLQQQLKLQAQELEVQRSRARLGAVERQIRKGDSRAG